IWFALATAADLITPAGCMLVGSAQLRRDRYLLQHGSIRLWPHAACHRQVFGEDMAPMADQPRAIPSAPDETFLEQLKGLIQQALTRSLGITFAALPLSAAEIAEIRARSSSLARAVI
ncbi:MAG: hypothetical protein AAGF98_13320, partial [Cyanobacteria bacterium P01_H01_bin.153]